MMRKCHLNTCPVGVATQDPELREKFTGKPEHVINFFFFVAEEVREHHGAARLPHASTRWSVASTCSTCAPASSTGRRAGSTSRASSIARTWAPRSRSAATEKQDHGLDKALDHELIERAQAGARDAASRCRSRCRIRNVNRTVGAMLSGEVARRYGHAGLPEDTIQREVQGHGRPDASAPCSRHGITFELEGDANDYVGKGLSGGRIVIYPAAGEPAHPRGEHHRRQHGAVRRDHGRGLLPRRRRRALLRAQQRRHRGGRGRGRPRLRVHDAAARWWCSARPGRNFAAGMSGGIAYVLDEEGDFVQRCNMAMVELEPIPRTKRGRCRRQRGTEAHGKVQIDHVAGHDDAMLKGLCSATCSSRAASAPGASSRTGRSYLPKFVKVMPHRVPPSARRDGRGAGTPDAPKRRGGERLHRSPLGEGREQRMGKITGFLEIERKDRAYAPVTERVKDYREFVQPLADAELSQQGARCMDCGIPFCQTGLPARQHHPGLERPRLPAATGARRSTSLHSTNNFPEFTGRVCPAPCEAACVLNINDDPVSIKSIEQAIVDKGWADGLDRAAAARAQDRQAASRSSAPGPPASPRRSSSRAPATTSRCSSETTASAACCATASPTSRWRRTSSTGAWRRWPARA